MEKAVRKEELTVQSLISEIVRSEVENAVRAIMDEYKPQQEPAKYKKIDEVVDYVNGKGLQISKSKIYKLTAENKIPYRRFGDRLMVFDVEELDKWINNQLEAKPNPVAKAVAASARRK